MPKQPPPEPTWKRYDKYYRRGFDVGMAAKHAGIARHTFLEQWKLALKEEDDPVPLCMWTDFKDGCTDGYDGINRRGSDIDR